MDHFRPAYPTVTDRPSCYACGWQETVRLADQICCGRCCRPWDTEQTAALRPIRMIAVGDWSATDWRRSR